MQVLVENRLPQLCRLGFLSGFLLCFLLGILLVSSWWLPGGIWRLPVAAWRFLAAAWRLLLLGLLLLQLLLLGVRKDRKLHEHFMEI